MKTIVVDDDFTCRCWLKGVLRKIGFQIVSEAANGQEAVHAVTTHHPDLVLLDVSMPVKTGPEALPEILAAHPETLVVMLTSIADEATVVDCLEKGAVDYLRKDATIEEIHQTLSSLQPSPHPTR